MLLLVGLGNPGAEYQHQRHNVGFMAVDAIADRQRFSAARRKFQGELREGALGDFRAFTLKPQTFMNESGRAVGEAVRFFKLAPAQVVVFHDELDLAPGKVKVKQGGGHAGHNGLRSIEAHIGAEFRRVRLGIGHPGDKARVTGHVLGDFAKADAAWLAALLEAIASAAPMLTESDATFSTALAQILNPQPPKPPRPTPPAPPPPTLDGTAPAGQPGPFADALAPLKRDDDTP